MCYGTTMIFAILGENIVLSGCPVRPGRLPGHAATITGNTDDIKALQRGFDPIGEEIIVYPNIIMDKDKYFGNIGCFKGLVVYHGQSRITPKSDTRVDAFIEG
jgi:hypothetical protein